MNRSIRRPWRAGLIVLPFALVTASASGGPLMLIGDAADDHGSPLVYKGLFEDVLGNVTNFGTGILAIGVAPDDARRRGRPGREERERPERSRRSA